MPIFSINFLIENCHTEGGRATHTAFIDFLKKTRLAFLAKHGMTEDCIVSGVGFVIGELNIQYRAAVREGEKISVDLSVTKIEKESAKSCSLFYQVRGYPGDRVVALARTDIVFVNTMNEKATYIPGRFLEIVQEAQEKPQPSFLVSRL